jgi:single-strand DNA-binding protein
MNKVCITGRWTSDPQIRHSDDKTIARGTIAIDRRGEGADFPSVVAFGKTAEHIEKYHHKGTKAEITGHIQTGKYTSKDGVTVFTTDIVIDEIGFGESKHNSEVAKETATASEADDFVVVEDEEGLPFV